MKPLVETYDQASQIEQLVIYSRALDKLPILSGQVIEATFPTAATNIVIRHSLRRSYTGGMIIGTSGATDTTYPVFTIVHPHQAVVDGISTKEYVKIVTASTISRDETVTIYLF